MDIKKLLEIEVKNKSYYEVNEKNLDPILIAKEKKDEYISLVCALFAYGNVKAIIKFLRSIDFDILEENEEKIKKNINHYYRFQSSEDVKQFFITLKRLKNEDRLENIFLKGYSFLIGNRYKRKTKGCSPYKRWNMYLRWMVRDDEIDFGLWKNVDTKDLIIPLDTHTFKVSQKLGLLTRKTYDLESAIQLTNKLKEFDKDDPVKYDFAIYRLGQNKEILDFK